VRGKEGGQERRARPHPAATPIRQRLPPAQQGGDVVGRVFGGGAGRDGDEGGGRVGEAAARGERVLNPRCASASAAVLVAGHRHRRGHGAAHAVQDGGQGGPRDGRVGGGRAAFPLSRSPQHRQRLARRGEQAGVHAVGRGRAVAGKVGRERGERWGWRGGRGRRHGGRAGFRGRRLLLDGRRLGHAVGLGRRRAGGDRSRRAARAAAAATTAPAPLAHAQRARGRRRRQRARPGRATTAAGRTGQPRPSREPRVRPRAAAAGSKVSVHRQAAAVGGGGGWGRQRRAGAHGARAPRPCLGQQRHAPQRGRRARAQRDAAAGHQARHGGRRVGEGRRGRRGRGGPWRPLLPPRPPVVRIVAVGRLVQRVPSQVGGAGERGEGGGRRAEAEAEVEARAGAHHLRPAAQRGVHGLHLAPRRGLGPGPRRALGPRGRERARVGRRPRQSES